MILNNSTVYIDLEFNCYKTSGLLKQYKHLWLWGNTCKLVYY